MHIERHAVLMMLLCRKTSLRANSVPMPFKMLTMLAKQACGAFLLRLQSGVYNGDCYLSVQDQTIVVFKHCLY